ncbi:MAG: DUF3617 domain-containing protein [Sulfurimicrobium sp.]|nr:DUF3617 domain-containing protein [Sulfurimicrobium sp.]
MKKLLLLSLPVLFAVSQAYAEPNMQDGMWEITSKTEIQGLPPGSMPPNMTHTMKQCMTKQDAVPREQVKNPNCKMVNTKVDGNAVTWNMQCRNKEGIVDSVGKITYSGSTFSGETRMNTSGGGQKMNMVQKMSGRRIGDCKK